MASHSPTTLSTCTTQHHGLLKLLTLVHFVPELMFVEEGKSIFSLLFIRFPDAGYLVVSNLLEFTLREAEDFGLYSCTVRNISADFSVQNSSKTSCETFWAFHF